MTKDPAATLRAIPTPRPPRIGPGSGKDAWAAFGTAMGESNTALWEMVEAQSNVIVALEAEVARLRAKLAERKPKGGRPKVSERTAAMVRADLASGLSCRQAAARNGVSAMTASRLGRG